MSRSTVSTSIQVAYDYVNSAADKSIVHTGRLVSGKRRSESILSLQKQTESFSCTCGRDGIYRSECCDRNPVLLLCDSG